MKLTTQQAAQATGKSRSTIWRAAKSGKVSAERTATGDFMIDVAELERVFGSLNRPGTSHQVSTKPLETYAARLYGKKIKNRRQAPLAVALSY